MPLRLYGKGDYALTDVKEMEGTGGFLDLADIVKNCQNNQTISDVFLLQIP